MQPFICPQCGHQSSFDPWTASAHCPECGYAPPRGLRLAGRLPKKKTGTHQRFLDELLSCWDGTHAPDPHFAPTTSELAMTFFGQYLRAMGEDPHLLPGNRARFVANYHPSREEILSFVHGYGLLRRGEPAAAAGRFGALARARPQFADPWIWLAATTDDAAARIEYLEKALVREPARPLARDAMAIARGRVSPASEQDSGDGPTLRLTICPQCGGSLRYEAGAEDVACAYCGNQLRLERTNMLHEKSTLISDLRLRRRYGRQTWDEIERIAHCEACGAELALFREMSERCAFCGSTSVLVGDNLGAFEQPDAFLPFEIDEAKAADAIRGAARWSLRGARSLVTRKAQQLEQLQGVYVPFWVFDGFVETRTWRAGIFAQAIPLSAATTGGEVMMLNDLIFAAVEVPPPEQLKRLFPFRMGALVPYEPRLLAEWPAALYHKDVEAVVEVAYEELIALARKRVGPLIDTEPSGQGQLRQSFQVSSTTYQLVLLPAWVATLRRGERTSLVLANGQTGKVAFERR